MSGGKLDHKSINCFVNGEIGAGLDFWGSFGQYGPSSAEMGTRAGNWHRSEQSGLLRVVGERKVQKCAYLGTFAHLGGDLGIFGFEY